MKGSSLRIAHSFFTRAFLMRLQRVDGDWGYRVEHASSPGHAGAYLRYKLKETAVQSPHFEKYSNPFFILHFSRATHVPTPPKKSLIRRYSLVFLKHHQ